MKLLRHLLNYFKKLIKNSKLWWLLFCLQSQGNRLRTKKQDINYFIYLESWNAHMGHGKASNSIWGGTATEQSSARNFWHVAWNRCTFLYIKPYICASTLWLNQVFLVDPETEPAPGSTAVLLSIDINSSSHTDSSNSNTTVTTVLPMPHGKLMVCPKTSDLLQNLTEWLTNWFSEKNIFSFAVEVALWNKCQN